MLVAGNSLQISESDKEELKARPKKRQFEILQKLVGSFLASAVLFLSSFFVSAPERFRCFSCVTRPNAGSFQKTDYSSFPEGTL